MLPKMGRKLHQGRENLPLAGIVAEALDTELGRTHQAVKTAMRWTGASERSVKHWLAGTHVPRGMHLVSLMRHSDTVLKQLLIASGRERALVGLELTALRITLSDILTHLDHLVVGNGEALNGEPRALD
jgi:hypothetical protein